MFDIKTQKEPLDLIDEETFNIVYSEKFQGLSFVFGMTITELDLILPLKGFRDISPHMQTHPRF